MNLFDDLLNVNKWNSFLSTKLESNFLSKKEIKELTLFISEKRYLPICKLIVSSEYEFTIPRKVIINRTGKNKKRIVYSYTDEEVIILKYINYLLYDYDEMFSDNLYSFRKNKSVKEAIHKIQKIGNMYAYKVDISNYFNSIPIDRLLLKLKEDIDKELYKLLFEILTNKKVSYNNELLIEEKGIMAGVPVSAFLANFYLKNMDKYFDNNNILYFRYADDIIKILIHIF